MAVFGQGMKSILGLYNECKSSTDGGTLFLGDVVG